jgi:hypothetical protein
LKGGHYGEECLLFSNAVRSVRRRWQLIYVQMFLLLEKHSENADHVTLQHLAPRKFAAKILDNG